MRLQFTFKCGTQILIVLQRHFQSVRDLHGGIVLVRELDIVVGGKLALVYYPLNVILNSVASSDLRFDYSSVHSSSGLVILVIKPLLAIFSYYQRWEIGYNPFEHIPHANIRIRVFGYMQCRSAKHLDRL